MKYSVEIEGESFEVEVQNPVGRATVNGQQYSVDLCSVDGRWLYSLIVDNCPYEAFVKEEQGEYTVALRGEPFQVVVQDPRVARLAAMVAQQPQAPPTQLPVKAPLPGLVVAVEAEPGEQVKKGQVLLVLEAMKMENDLCAPRDGTIQEVLVAGGDKVEKGQVLLVLD